MTERERGREREGGGGVAEMEEINPCASHR